MKNTFILAGIVFVAIILIAGCQKTETGKTDSISAASTQAVTNSTCPVTGGPVKKSIYTWYNGKKVYFSCEGCKQQFEENPEKYMDKLPQFQK